MTPEYYQNLSDKQEFFYENRKVFINCLKEYMVEETLSTKQFATTFFKLYEQVLQNFKTQGKSLEDTENSKNVLASKDFLHLINKIRAECFLFMQSSDYKADLFRDKIFVISQCIESRC
jgi:hypothetical protein